MQIQTKRQLKIELDNNDMLQAVNDYLNKHGQRITPEELNEVKFVNSVKDGLRANINITEDSTTDTEALAPVVVAGHISGVGINHIEAASIKTEQIQTPEPVAVEHAKEHIAEVGLEVVEPTAEPVEAEAPGQVEPSTVDDVMGLDDIKAIVESNDAAAATPAPVAEEDEPVPAPAEEAPRKANLFL